MEDGLTWQGEDLLANRGEQRLGIPAGQIGPPDRTGEHTVAHKRRTMSLEYYPAG